MTVEVYEPSDYSLLAEWYVTHGQVAPPPEFIPAMMFKVMEAGWPILFTGVVWDPSIPVAQIDFFLGKPGLSIWDTQRASIYALEFLMSYLPGKGVYSVVAHIEDKRLSKAVQRQGFLRVASNVDILTTPLY